MMSVKNNTQVLIYCRNNKKFLGRVRAIDKHCNMVLENVREMWTEVPKETAATQKEPPTKKSKKHSSRSSKHVSQKRLPAPPLEVDFLKQAHLDYPKAPIEVCARVFSSYVEVHQREVEDVKQQCRDWVLDERKKWVAEEKEKLEHQLNEKEDQLEDSRVALEEARNKLKYAKTSTSLLETLTHFEVAGAEEGSCRKTQRNLDQLEALSKKLRSKTVRSEAPSQSIAATRVLAREGINAEQLARDLKSFELKTTFEDVFPVEATSVEVYLQQASLGGGVGNLQRIRAFLRIRLRDYGVLDFDAGDVRRQPPVDTTWQQIFFCLRSGYYDEARNVALSSRASHQFVPLLTEWINTGGMVPEEIAAAASEECERMLRSGDRVGRGAYDKKKLLLYAIISGSRRHIDRLLRDQPPLFNTIEDFLWFQLSAVRDCPGGSSSFVLSDGLVPYSLDDLQIYLNKFEPSYYTKNGKDLLVYPYILLLSMQLLPAVLYLSKETGDEGYNVDAAHLSIVLADHAVLSEGAGTGQKLGVMDASAEVSTIIRQYGSMYLRLGDLQMALEYYAQSAAAVGGGQLSWTGRGNVDQQRQRNLMLKQLLTELLLRDGGIYLLLGARGAGEEGELGRFVADPKGRQQFLFEAAGQCQEAGMYDKSIEIQKRVGSFSAALDTINKCLSEAICSLFRGRLDGESRTAGLIQSGNEILETYTYYPDVSLQEREHVFEQQTVLRQLESILSVHKLARLGNHVDALREVAKLPFLPLDPRGPDIAVDVFENLSPHVQACIPDLLKVSLTCVDNVTDSDGSLRALRAKIASFIANNSKRNWPRDLYERVAQRL